MEHYLGSERCSCGKIHTAAIDDVIIGNGVISRLPAIIEKYGAKKPFILADVNPFAAAGKAVCYILDARGIGYSRHIFPDSALEPDEKAVGAAFMHYDPACDVIVGVGSGVINDIGKILSNVSGRKYIIVATAPSMDGYASATSSMSMDGLKVSLNSRCADVIIGDIDILKQAPEHMLKAGLGDMLAKYISIAEWRIGSLITGEYYCERVAQLIRTALKKCVDNAQGLLKREDAALQAVFEGLVIGGVAMAYAGVSRPASGCEHYISHMLDMRGEEFNTPTDFHGTQCATATYIVTKLYEKIKAITPDESKAISRMADFKYEDRAKELRRYLGKAAESMISLEAKEKKYDLGKHAARLEVILEKWDDILRIIDEELPSVEEFEAILDSIEAPKTLEEIGLDSSTLAMTLKSTKDIRDKYVLPRLLWDIGELDEVCEKVFG